MNHHFPLFIILIVALVSVPAVAASQPQVPTPTGFLGGRESAGETETVAVVPAPTAKPPGSPVAADVPGASECLVGPGGPDFETMTDPPARGIVSPDETRQGIPSRTLAELPQGEPADNSTVQEITQTMRRFFGCANSREIQKLMALYTDDYFRRATTVEVTYEESSEFWDWFFSPSKATATSYETPSFPENSPMPEFTNVTILPDGRVGAIVNGPDFDPIFFAFAREEPDGPYLVDETILIESNTDA